MSKITTFGEVMLRLQPLSYKRIIQSDFFEAYFGGSEANVAVALAQWGEDTAFVTRLPENPLGQACANNLRQWGINTGEIGYSDGRIGIYFTEKGASQRPSNLIYDRDHSVFSESKSSDFDFDRMMSHTEWFHFSGITPALNQNLSEITQQAVTSAGSHHVRISCDLNYRSKLWNTKKAGDVMSGLIQGIDVLIANENQAGEVFEIYGDSPEKTAAALAKKFQIGSVALTIRRTISGEINEFSAVLYSGGQCCKSRTYSMFMIDRIGGGDAFSAGLIYSLINGRGVQQSVDFAAAAACYKHSVEGDVFAGSVSEIESLLRSDGAGRFIR